MMMQVVGGWGGVGGGVGGGGRLGGVGGGYKLGSSTLGVAA